MKTPSLKALRIIAIRQNAFSTSSESQILNEINLRGYKMGKEENYQWLFSDTEFENGKIDIHFVLNTSTGNIQKILQRRTEYQNKEEEKVSDL